MYTRRTPVMLGVMLPQAKQLQEARRQAWNRSLQCTFRGVIVLQTPWSQTSRLQNCETINVCCFSHLDCGALLKQPWESTTGHNLSPPSHCLLHPQDNFPSAWECTQASVSHLSYGPISLLPQIAKLLKKLLTLLLSTFLHFLWNRFQTGFFSKLLLTSTLPNLGRISQCLFNAICQQHLFGYQDALSLCFS